MTTNPTTNPETENELYLHHSDHHNYVLSTSLLNERNYSHWKRSVEVSLTAKNKLGFITNTCIRPTNDAQDAIKWDRCNSMVISWLVYSVEKEIAESVLYCRTAVQRWKEHGNRFGKSNRTRIYQVQRDLISLSHGNSSVSSYFTKMKKLWDAYALLVEDVVCDCGSKTVLNKIIQDQQVVAFLMGLNESYNAVRGTILMMSPAPYMDGVYQMVLQEDQQRGIRNIGKPETNSMAFAVQKNPSTNPKKPKFCDHCKIGGHNMENCYKLHGYPSNGAPSTGSTSFYDHCKVKGHAINKCWKIHGFPQGKGGSKFYCTHCKTGGHSIERFWKVHGYPPGKGPSAMENASINESNTASYSSPQPITQQQYDQLISLLIKHSPVEGLSHVAFLAGPFDEQAISDWP